MPANLSPEYHRAEARFRQAQTVEEKIEALEEMLRVIPKHKGTDGLQGDIKARLAKLRKAPASKAGKASHSHLIPREGAGQIALVGPPNTGKSSLVTALTHATPEVAAYPFTTREATPGMMRYEDIAFQLVDLPPTDESGPIWSPDGRFVFATSLVPADPKPVFASIVFVDLDESPPHVRLLRDSAGAIARVTPAIATRTLDADTLRRDPLYLPELANIMAEAIAKQRMQQP